MSDSFLLYSSRLPKFLLVLLTETSTIFLFKLAHIFYIVKELK